MIDHEKAIEMSNELAQTIQKMINNWGSLDENDQACLAHLFSEYEGLAYAITGNDKLLIHLHAVKRRWGVE